MTSPTPGRRGLMLVVSSPSGAGKTTLTRLLIERDRDIVLSVSVTTRERRTSEAEGSHYFFKSGAEFARMRDSGELLEWAEVHGNFYGTPRDKVESELAAGHDVLFDIDWQGTRQLYAKARADLASVFVLPPDAASLRRRLEHRAEDEPAVIQQRLANAMVEIAHWREYDYVIVNDDLDRSFAELRAVLAAERMRRSGANPTVAEPGAAAMADALRPEHRTDVVSLVDRLGRELKAMAG
ncbi:MAG TPA: guanylate kinase [Hyphomicrobiales bacterium]|nr:guanylate kinase [Hyphomicrobiales bacterium]